MRQATATIDVKQFNFFSFDEDSDAAIEEKDSDESDDSDESSSFESKSDRKTPEPEKPVEEPLSPAAIKRQ